MDLFSFMLGQFHILQTRHNFVQKFAVDRVLARIIFKRTKKHVDTTMTRRLREIFLVKCQKQAFSFNRKQKCIAMHFCMF
jgi:arginyl-tRNA--protein-N-Asp/Glu arginylyltransferase